MLTGHCTRWRFRTPYRMRSWPDWISSIGAKEVAQLGAVLGRSFPMSSSRPLPHRTRGPYQGWRSW